MTRVSVVLCPFSPGCIARRATLVKGPHRGPTMRPAASSTPDGGECDRRALEGAGKAPAMAQIGKIALSDEAPCARGAMIGGPGRDRGPAPIIHGLPPQGIQRSSGLSCFARLHARHAGT